MKLNSINPLAFVAIPAILFAFNHLLAQIGLTGIDYTDWPIWVIFIGIIASSFKIKFH